MVMKNHVLAILGQKKRDCQSIKNELGNQEIGASFELVDKMQFGNLSTEISACIVLIHSKAAAEALKSFIQKNSDLPTICILNKGLRYASYRNILADVPLYRFPKTEPEWRRLITLVRTVLSKHLMSSKESVKSQVQINGSFDLHPNAISCDVLRSSGAIAGALTIEFDRVLSQINDRIVTIKKTLKHDLHISPDLDTIEQEVQHATHITTQLRSLLKGEKGLYGRIDLNQLLREIIPLVKSILGNLVALTLELHPGRLFFQGDHLQLQRALFNIFVNAKDALGKEGALRVKTGKLNFEDSAELGLPEARYGSVWLAIQDNGLGMTGKVKENLFKPFYSTKSAQEHPGLGMVMVKHIIDQHQGMIHIDSQAGRGTTITLHFQALPPDAKSEQFRQSVEHNTRNILVICHEPVMLQLLTDVLRQEQFRPLQTNRFWEGVELLYEHRHEVGIVILDALHPETELSDQIERLRQIHSSVKIIVIRNQFFNGQTEDQQIVGVKYLEKPFRLKYLLASIAEFNNPTAVDS